MSFGLFYSTIKPSQGNANLLSHICSSPFSSSDIVNPPPMTHLSLVPVVSFNAFKITLSAGLVSLSIIHTEKEIVLLIVCTEDFTQSVS